MLQFARAIEAEAMRRAAPQWLPIESAPKDGTRFLAYENGDTYGASIYALDEYGAPYWQSYCGQSVTYRPDPTHWMPLPAAPAQQEVKPC